MRLMRAHGWSRAIQGQGLEDFCSSRNIDLSEYTSIDCRYLFIDEGYNLRLTEPQAVMASIQLKKLDFSSYAFAEKYMLIGKTESAKIHLDRATKITKDPVLKKKLSDLKYEMKRRKK